MDSATLAGQLAQYDSGRVNSTDALNDALKQYGVPEIRNTVSGLRTTLTNATNAYNAVDPSVTGRTQGSLVTEAQRTKQVSNERQPIAQQLDSTGRALSDNQSALQSAESQANQLATNRVNDWQMGRQALQSQYDNAYKSEQDKAAAALAAQQFAESQRQFNVSQANANSRAASSSASLSPGQVKLQAGQAISSQLASKTGKDGYVSNETWSGALNDAVANGFTTREFYQKYSQFVNPKYKTSYAGWANR